MKPKCDLTENSNAIIEKSVIKDPPPHFYRWLHFWKPNRNSDAIFENNHSKKPISIPQFFNPSIFPTRRRKYQICDPNRWGQAKNLVRFSKSAHPSPLQKKIHSIIDSIFQENSFWYFRFWNLNFWAKIGTASKIWCNIRSQRPENSQTLQ